MDRLQPLYLHETTFISHNSLKLSSIPTWSSLQEKKTTTTKIDFTIYR